MRRQAAALHTLFFILCYFPFGQPVLEERTDSGKAILAIHIFFNHIEGKVIASAKRPDGQSHQSAELPRRVFEQNQPDGQTPKQQKQSGFEVDQRFAFKITHG